LNEPFTDVERETRLLLGWQINHLDYVVSSCTGSEPISFKLFQLNLKPFTDMPLFCQLTLQAVSYTKEIYEKFFDSGPAPDFQAAAAMTETVLKWRRDQPDNLKPLHLDNKDGRTSHFVDIWLVRTVELPTGTVDFHQTAYLTGKCPELDRLA
jgi:hypothetical protein